MLRKQHYFPLGLLILLGLIYAYISWTDTFYRMGIFLVPIVLVVSAAISGTISFFTKRLYHQWFLLFCWGSSLLFAGLIAEHLISNYKPTYTVYIPENYEGMVYLFPAKEKNEEVFIDQNGIGYFMPASDVNLEILHGNEDISNAINQYGRGTIHFPLADSIHYEAIEFTCFDVEKGRFYSSSPWNQPHAKCMEAEEFKALVAAGIIDEKLIEKEVWPK